MSRGLRFYGKKRGGRRSGPSWRGQAGLLLFFALLFGAGCYALGVTVVELLLPQWRAQRDFVETTGVVLATRLNERPADPTRGPTYRAEFQLRYAVSAEQTQTAWATADMAGLFASNPAESQSLVERYAVGGAVRCYYDPRRPEHVILSRGDNLFAWWMLLLPISFIAIGGGGFVYHAFSWTTSPERRAAFAQQAAALSVFQQAHQRHERYPTLPGDDFLTDSPGTRMTYRLPSAAAPLGTAIVAVVAAGWLLAGGAFALPGVRSLLRGAPDWIALWATAAFAGLGWMMYRVYWRPSDLGRGIGSTIVEISAHPLRPGGTYELYLVQTGRARLESFRVLLACTEEAVYSQGTNTRSAQRRVYEQTLLVRSNLQLAPGAPFECRGRLSPPVAAMHSFRAEHNAVRWSIIAEGRLPAGQTFVHEFPVVVLPPPRIAATDEHRRHLAAT